MKESVVKLNKILYIYIYIYIYIIYYISLINGSANANVETPVQRMLLNKSFMAFKNKTNCK